MDWRTQLIKSGLNSFKKHGVCTSGEIIFDWISETRKVADEIDLPTKNLCWKKALKEAKGNKDNATKHYKRNLVNKFLERLDKEGIEVSINVDLIKFKV